jgi:1-aminocyclopropane-1-carboxylate deaminase
MQLEFVSRRIPFKKWKRILENLEKQFGNFYLIPEGGTNEL